MSASVIRDLVSSARGLWRAKLFTFVSIATIALASGVAGSVFGVVDTLLLRSLPYPASDRLIAIYSGLDGRESFPLSVAEYLDYRFDAASVDAVGAYRNDSGTIQLADGGIDVRPFARITPSLQNVLGITTTLGRTFTEDEGREGAAAVAMVSSSFWSSHLGSDPKVVEGGTVVVSGVRVEIVGVVRDGFALPGTTPAVYLPLQMPDAQLSQNRSGHDFIVIARLKDGVSVASAVDEGRRLMERWEEEFAGGHVLTASSHPLRIERLSDYVLGGVSRSIGLLVWAAVLVIVLACANLSTLMLSRAEARKVELGMRSALGAGFGRLTRLVLIESLSISLAGGILGIAMSGVVLRWVGSQQAGSIQVGANSLGMATIDLRLTTVTILIASVAGIVFGLLPAFAARRLDLVQLLSAGGGRSRSGGRSLHRAFNTLVFVQLALAAVLLNGTAMLLDGFNDLTKVEPGFDAENRIAFRVQLDDIEYDEGTKIIAFYDRLRAELPSIPGVERAAAARAIPLRRRLGTEAFINEGVAWRDGDPSSQVYFQMVSPGYYETMGIPILAGRPIDEGDRSETPKIAMLNRSAAEAYFGGVENALGKRIVPLFMGGPDAEPTTIVGISENVRHSGPVGAVEPEIVLPIAQAEGWVFATLLAGEWVVEVEDGASESVMSGIRARMSSIAPGVPILSVATMSEEIRESVAYERFLAQLTTAFGVVALAIAAVGVLGVVWFSVNTRWRELGVRIALGQAPRSVATSVVARGLRLGIGAAATGTVLTFMGSGLVAAVVHNSGRPEPLLLVFTTAVLLGSVVVACLGPALKAGRIDPARVLGAE